MKSHIFLCLALLFTAGAKADWASFGVAVKCDPRQSTFEIATTIEVSSGNAGAIPAKRGYKQLKRGISNIVCPIAGKKVRATIYFLPYGEHMCQGGGIIDIVQLSINKQSLYKDQHFSWFCDLTIPTPFLITIQSNKGNISINECSATDWYYGDGYKNAKCIHRPL
jgi:hypothetical protein